MQTLRCGKEFKNPMKCWEAGGIVKIKVDVCLSYFDFLIIAMYLCISYAIKIIFKIKILWAK
jgi:hypothetical protein